MKYSIFVLCGLLAIPTLPSAGPWARTPGETFLSFSISPDTQDEQSFPAAYGAIYAEHGLTESLTAGAIAGSDLNNGHKAVAFLRRFLGNWPGGWLSAGYLGFGMHDSGPATVTGYTVGRGIESNLWNGWVVLDWRGYVDMNNFNMTQESEITVGNNFGKDWKGFVQLRRYRAPSQSALFSLAGQAAWQFSEGHYFTGGLDFGLIGKSGARLEIGMWHHF